MNSIKQYNTHSADVYRDKGSPGGVVETETGVADCRPVEVGTATVEEEREGWEGTRLTL